MAHQAMFDGLIYDESGQPVTVKSVGGEAHYVVDDDGFLRHIASETVDRPVLALFIEQLQQNRDLAVDQALRMMGSDDLFARAAVESSLDNVNVDAILAQGLPAEARTMLGMMGFRVIINYHGELVRLDQPTLEIDDDDL